MNPPSFTTRPERVARLQYNYDQGLARESLPTDLREKLDTECLDVSEKKLKFLFQNAMESYTPEMKNMKVLEFNEANATANEKKSKSYLRFV